MAFYENIKYIIAGEWLLLLLAFGLIFFRKQAFEVFETAIHLSGHLLVSATAMMAFVCEAILVFAGNLGMQSSMYLLHFYVEHLEPWLVFIIIYDFVRYVFEMIFFIIKSDYIFGRRFLSGARIAIHPYESKDLVTPLQRIVLLQ